MGRRGYPPEFRRKVLDLIEAGRPIAEVAQAIWGSATSRSTPGAAKTASTEGLEPGLTSAEQGELAAAKRRIAELETELRGHAPGDGAGPRGGAPKRRFQAVAVMAAEHIPVEVACRVLDVSTSGYYAWRSRPPSARAIRHAWLTDLILKVHRTLVAPTAPCGCMPSCASAAASRSATTPLRC